MDSQVERNSPTSPVCQSEFAEYDSIQQSVAAEPTHNDGPTPGSLREFGGGPEDRTPRSEVPTPTPALATSNGQTASIQPNYEPSEYFEPRPQRPIVVGATPNDTAVPPAQQNASTTATFLTLTEQDRPHIHRDLSSTSTASTVTVKGNVAQQVYAESQRRQNLYPNQSFFALQSQSTPRYLSTTQRMNGREPGHGQSSYSSSHIATLSNIAGEEKGSRLGGPRTQGNSPANTPGLFDLNKSKPAPLPVTEGGAYPSPFLNQYHRHTPRETHVADVSVDSISGRKLVNDYEILDELGRGVHGKVKLGRNLNTGQMVAIKIVERNAKRRRLGKNDSHEHKIRREVAILKKVRHGNVVSLLEVIDDPSRRKVYLVLEYVEFGEVKWRTPGANEIILVEHRRFERYSKGIVDSDAAELEDARIIRKAEEQRRRLERRKQRELQRQRASQSDSQMHTWSMEHGGNSDDEDVLSRISSSTTPSKQNSSRNLDDVDAVADAYRPNKSSSTSLASEARSKEGIEAELMGTMFGPYDTEPLRARTPSVAETPEYASVDFDEIDRLPEHFHYVPLMTLAEARRSIRDTVLGLEYLHYQGVVHRDIKPANLLVNRENRVKISDFGVSYIGRAPRDELEDGEQSASEAPDNEDDGDIDNPLDLAKTVGTPAFFAPELCDLDPDSEPAQITQAIDVWAVGVTLYCLVYGRVPFWTDSNSKWAIMNVIATEEVFIPEQRLKAVEEKVERRPGSSNPTMNSNKRRVHDLEHEPIGEDLRDLLRRLLIKDPRKRITLKEVKRHPWVLQGIDDAAQWLRDTAPERQTQGRKIELTDADLEEAVLPIGIFEKMKSAVRKFGGAMATNMGFARSDSRRRAKSTAASDGGRGPPSTVSSNSHVSLDSHRRREQRRPSVRVDEDFSEALKNSRDLNDHSFARHVVASPSVNVESPYFLAALSNPPSPHIEFSASAAVPNRRKSTKLSNAQSVMSTATSVRTIRQSDISQGHSSDSSAISAGLAESSQTVESASGSGLGGLFGGASRRLIRSMRSRDGITESPPINRERSLDRLYLADDDAHGGPSVALSNTVAAGHVDLPPSLRNNSPIPSSGPMAKRNSIANPELAHLADPAHRASRQSSVSSRSSRLRQPVDLLEDRPPTRNSTSSQAHSYDTDPDSFERAHADLIRRRVLEDQRKKEQQSASSSSSRPTTGVSQSTCPPSPDDLDLSLRTTPDSLNSPRLATSSSEDPFPSGISQSTSSPSVPSIISAISSVAADGPMMSFHSDCSGDAPSEGTLNGAFESSNLTRDEEHLNPTQTGQSSGRNSADDEDSDEDDGLVMGCTRSKTQSHVPSSESSRHKYRASTHSTHRRRESGGGLSKVRSRSVTNEGHHN